MLRIRELREEQGISLDKLGEIFHVQKSSLSRIETGKQEPKADLINGLADYFGVTTDYLLGRTDERTFTVRDEKSIQNDLKKIMEEFKTGKAGPVCYDGVEFESDELELIENAMETALKIAKLKNKEKYTPNKYKNISKG